VGGGGALTEEEGESGGEGGTKGMSGGLGATGKMVGDKVNDMIERVDYK
jgi:hypothetical protein